MSMKPRQRKRGKSLLIRKISLKKNSKIQVSSKKDQVNVSVATIATDIDVATRDTVGRGVGVATAAIGAEYPPSPPQALSAETAVGFNKRRGVRTPSGAAKSRSVPQPPKTDSEIHRRWIHAIADGRTLIAEPAPNPRASREIASMIPTSSF
jgi:hypothetical protein